MSLSILLPGLLVALTLGLISWAPAASADPSPDAWARLRKCESGGNYGVVARNGHYGAYQFSLGTWRSVGGVGRPNRATRTEQDYRALTLYRMRGWQPWTCARHVGLRNDADARSRVKPTMAEARQVSGAAAPSPGTTAVAAPAWGGKSFEYGDCDPALRTFQLRMNDLGYDFEGTGCYYAKTRTAVMQLKRANDLGTSGTLGPRTWAAAWTGKAPR